MSPFRRLSQSVCVLAGCFFLFSLPSQSLAALTGTTERIRRMIAEHDFPGVEPVMDAQHQFVIFSPEQNLSRELLDLVMKLRPDIYHFFGISKIWDQPAFVLIFPTREKYGLPGTGGAAFQFKYRGQNVRMVGSFIQEDLKDRILPHEMVHFLIADLSTLGTGRQGAPPLLPVFINEGIAEYFSASPGRRVLFEKTAWESFQAGTLEPFKKIVTSTATWVEALVGGETSRAQRAQAYSVISFLASLPDGNVKLRNYILSYATSAGRIPRESASLQAFEMAFRQDYFSWEQLQKRWVQYIQGREMVIIEGESASVLDSSGEKSDARSAPKRKLWLSGEKELRFHGANPGSFVVLQSPFPGAGAFDVFAIYTQGPRSGQFRLALNGKELPVTFEGYSSNEKVCEPVYYGKFLIAPGPVTARFSVLAKAPSSAGYEIGIDCLIFRRDRLLEKQNTAAARKYLQAGADGYRRGTFKEAEENFTAAANLVPWDSAPLEWRAHARIALRNFDAARQDVDAAIRLAPQNPGLPELRKRIEAAASQTK